MGMRRIPRAQSGRVRAAWHASRGERIRMWLLCAIFPLMVGVPAAWLTYGFPPPPHVHRSEIEKACVVGVCFLIGATILAFGVVTCVRSIVLGKRAVCVRRMFRTRCIPRGDIVGVELVRGGLRFYLKSDRTLQVSNFAWGRERTASMAHFFVKECGPVPVPPAIRAAAAGFEPRDAWEWSSRRPRAWVPVVESVGVVIVLTAAYIWRGEVWSWLVENIAHDWPWFVLLALAGCVVFVIGDVLAFLLHRHDRVTCDRRHYLVASGKQTWEIDASAIIGVEMRTGHRPHVLRVVYRSKDDFRVVRVQVDRMNGDAGTIFLAAACMYGQLMPEWRMIELVCQCRNREGKDVAAGASNP